jgi:hypothetical protein
VISTFTAFFDANALYGMWLRSLIVELAQTKLFRARWSVEIHKEWTHNLLQKRPDLERSKIENISRLMDEAVLDALVTGYEPLIPALNLPDCNDRHVLAAAITCGASCIVTFNLEDFPLPILELFGLHAVHPDKFLLDVESLSPSEFAAAVKEDLNHYIAPSKSVSEYADALRRAGVPQTADHIEKLSVMLDVPRTKE